jgi:hypothetical protein
MPCSNARRVVNALVLRRSARYESLRQVATDDVTDQLAPLTGATTSSPVLFTRQDA